MTFMIWGVSTVMTVNVYRSGVFVGVFSCLGGLIQAAMGSLGG
jgi:hypothetical protein